MTNEIVPNVNRYNPLGSWKPLIFPGIHKPLYDTVASLSKDNEVQGCLLYILVTGKLLIEFVARTSLELPDQFTSLSEKVHIWRCPAAHPPVHSARNVLVYDGWCELETKDPEDIRKAIDNIGRTINRMAFAFDSAIDWRLKYRFENHSTGYATPNANDMKHLRTLLSILSNESENLLIDSAIDWYNRGTSGRNVFVAFLCQYIALESIAIAVAEGDANFQLDIARGTKQEIRQQRRDCIKLLHDSLYQQEPLDFAFKAYFDCFVGLKKSVREVTEALFGNHHPYISWLFDNSQGPSLSEIRSDLAHGRFTLSNKADEDLVRSRLPNMTEVANQFIIQIIQKSVLGVSHGGAQWSSVHALEMSTLDPRVYLLASSEATLPQSDWSIRAEWCDW